MEKITFEEFKKEFEVFSPTDTVEKLESIKENYKSYIQSIEDSHYLEPIRSNFKSEFVSIQYYEKLNKELNFLDLKDDEIRIIVIPSFDPEFQIRILDDKIIVDRFINNQWHDIYTGINLNKSDVRSKSYFNSFNHLSTDIIEAIFKARTPKAKNVILDGVQYYFIHKTVKELKVTFKHSPDEESQTGVLIGRVEKMINELEKTESK